MDAYAPASALGWLDFDAAASERVATLLRSLEEPSTLDVLGLGTIRDAFSEMLFPGTSTIHTRLRYFMFVPWIFQRLETQRVDPTDFARRLRDNETRLIACLSHLGAGEGVIGRIAGRRLKTMPSAIYWNSLQSWGIRHLDLSIAEYGKRVATLARRQPDSDADVVMDTRTSTSAMWTSLPQPPDHFSRVRHHLRLDC